MGASKTEYYTERQNYIAKLSKALGHPARIAIVEYLIQSNTCICTDIVNELPLSQPTISQHLKELKNAGIIKGTIEGNSICYCVDEKVCDDLSTYFRSAALQLQQSKSSCC